MRRIKGSGDDNEVDDDDQRDVSLFVNVNSFNYEVAFFYKLECYRVDF